MIYDEALAKAVGSQLNPNNLENIKAYLKAAVLDSSALYLTSDTFSAYQDYINSLTGSNYNLIPSDYATSVVQELLGWELGALYIDMYFPETAKLAIEEMTQKIINEYENLLNGCTRMSPQTRSKAISKLKNITINAGYPDDIDDYCAGIPLPSLNDGGNLILYHKMYSNAYAEIVPLLVNEKATKGSWYIYPQTVNAMYDPTSNSITIPAGIIQPPFFDSSAEFEENLGGIGSVIAHEISHAFDSTGAQFDENGNLNNWWTESDFSAFKELCNKVISEYDEIQVGDSTVDGALTLDENIADLAGMSCILSLAGADNPNLEKLFKAYATSWRIKTTSEYDELMLKTDVHSPNKVRVNRVLSNFKEFSDFYEIVDGDGMYLPEDKRIDIWK